MASHRTRLRARIALAAIWALLAAVALTACLPEIRTPPGDFYTPPSPLPAAAPGTLIRAEPLRSAPAGARAWRVLYTSTGPDGAPIAVSGVVYAPVEHAPAGGRPVVAWAHPTTGVGRNCAPSLRELLLP